MNNKAGLSDDADMVQGSVAEVCEPSAKYLVRANYKRTEVGLIPEDWRIECVGDAFEICNNLRLPISRSSRNDMVGDYPYYGPTSIQGWINNFRAEGEYALIGEDGDHFLKWRNQPMTLLVQGKFNVNNHAHLVRGSSNTTAWFYWYFCNRDITASLTRQGASRYKLTKATLLKLPCPLPPLTEQRAIATALSDVDALIAGLERLVAKKRDIKQAAMQQLLTGQTRLPGFSGEWERVCAGDIGHFRGGNGFPSIQQGSLAGDYPFYKVSDMNNEGNDTFMSDANNWISETTRKMLGATVFPADSIIFAKVGAAVFLERKKILTRPSCIDNNLAALVLDKSRSVVRFVHYALMHIKFGTFVSTTALPSLNGAVLARISLRLPNLEEQTAIATVLSDLDADLSALESRLAKTRAIKQGMMQELLTGRTRLI
jgi:type I restriction enzyme S subunit